MKTIRIQYWIKRLPSLPYNHDETFDYSDELQNMIIKMVTKVGYQAMIYVSDIHSDTLVISIDDRHFKQR